MPGYKHWLLTVLILVCGYSQAQENQAVKLVTNEWEPFISQNKPYDGVVPRIVRDAYALVGVKVDFGFFPWSRGLALAKAGHWDGTFLWFYAEKRTKDFWYSDPIWSFNRVFFHRKDKPFDWTGYDDLTAHDIGLTVDYFYGEQMEKLEFSGKLSIERVSSEEVNLRKLLRGRIDLFASDVDFVSGLLAAKFNDGDAKMLTYHPKVIHGGDLYVLFSKKSKRSERLLALFNKGLKRLKRSGKYAQYVKESKKGLYDFDKSKSRD